MFEEEVLETIKKYNLIQKDDKIVLAKDQLFATLSTYNRLLEYKKENPLIVLDENHIKLMEHLTSYIIPDNDDYCYDISARDELLSRADDLSKISPRKK